MLSHFRIGTKLAGVFFFITLMLLALAGVMFYSYANITSSMKFVQDTVIRSAEINDGLELIYKGQQSALTFIITKDPKEGEAFDEVAKKLKVLYEKIRDNAIAQENKAAAQIVVETLGEIEKQKKAHLDQEEKVARIMAGGQGMADHLHVKLDELVAILVDANKNQQMIDPGTLTQMRLLLESKSLIDTTMLKRDHLHNAVTPVDRKKYAEELPLSMGELGEKLAETKRAIPSSDTVLTKGIDECIQDQENWKNFAKDFIPSDNLRVELQVPIAMNIQKIIGAAKAMLVIITDRSHSSIDKQNAIITASKTTGYCVTGFAIIFGIIISIVAARDVTIGFKQAIGAIKLIVEEGHIWWEVPQEDLNRVDEVGDLAKSFKLLLHQFQTIEQLAKDLAEGNYAQTVHVRSEQDTMNTYLNKMLDQTNTLLHEINESVAQVSKGTGEVSSASENLSSGAQEAAASLEEITASMAQISHQTKTNAESATQARDLANKASNAAAEGQTTMREMTSAMERITHNSSEIQRVIKVIDDIAFQTNLLALNAAVEAARAGQHGKGFAVVAEEVRNLASRSAKAAQETSELIAKSGHEIDKGGEISSHTAEVLDTIVEQIKQTTDLVSGIAAASNEQAIGVNQVTVGLQQIDSVTQQNTASAEETASAANEMGGMASNLQKLVSQFRLRA